MSVFAPRGVAAILAACIGASVSAAEPFTVTDAGGRKVVINDVSRIVSIGGAITEILYALGRDRQVVAVDATSIFHSVRYVRSRMSATCVSCRRRGCCRYGPR